MSLRVMHLSVGSVFFLFFLATGAYMLMHFPALYAGREEVRMMYRASHIYLLMAALINLMAANQLRWLAQERGFTIVAKLGSSLLLLAPFLFAWAFLTEPKVYDIGRPITFWAVVVLAVGVGLHTLNTWLLPLFGKRDG